MVDHSRVGEECWEISAGGQTTGRMHTTLTVTQLNVLKSTNKETPVCWFTRDFQDFEIG